MANELRINTAVTIFGKWAEKQFPESTPESVLNHLHEELLELIDAEVPRKEGEDTLGDRDEEAADVFLLLCHYCFKRDINLQAVAEAKFHINQGRNWETEPNEKGYFKHKDTTVTPIQLRAMDYVQNTNGGASIENFIEDHAPIGHQLWNELKRGDVVGVSAEGKIFLLPKGRDILQEEAQL